MNEFISYWIDSCTVDDRQISVQLLCWCTMSWFLTIANSEILPILALQTISQGPNEKFKDMSRTILKAKAEAEDKSSRTRTRTKFWPRGQLVLEDLTSLYMMSYNTSYSLSVEKFPRRYCLAHIDRYKLEHCKLNSPGAFSDGHYTCVIFVYRVYCKSATANC